MKKAKGTKKCIVKREITFKNYADALFNDEVIIRSQQRFRSDHHRVCTEEVNKIALSSNDDKRIQTFDKVTTFPYGTNVFKVRENEMLSKNKLNEPDEDIDNTKTEDKNDYIDMNRNNIIQVFQRTTRCRDKKSCNWKNGNCTIRQIVWVFWDDGHISELCEKWVHYDGNYAYIRFEELLTRSGEVLFTREYMATTSKYKSDTYINNDTLQMFKDFSIKDKTAIKTKDMLDKINNKIHAINKTDEGLAKIKADVTKKLNLIYEMMTKLQDEVYSDDPWLRLVELDKIEAIIEEAFNIVWKVLYENKNRINPEKIMIDKHKDIDGYVSELTDLINQKIQLVNDIYEAIDRVMSERNNKTNMIDEKIHKVCEMDNDTLNWIDDRLNEIMTRPRKK